MGRVNEVLSGVQYFFRERDVTEREPLYAPSPLPPQFDPRRPYEPKEKGGKVIIIDPDEDKDNGAIVIDL